jgi:hypothetical protein
LIGEDSVRSAPPDQARHRGLPPRHLAGYVLVYYAVREAKAIFFGDQ